jgi:hypothetical protein
MYLIAQKLSLSTESETDRTEVSKVFHPIFAVLSLLSCMTICTLVMIRFRTVCHGDLWMGSLMFRRNKEDKLETAIIDFHSTGSWRPPS